MGSIELHVHQCCVAFVLYVCMCMCMSVCRCVVFVYVCVHFSAYSSSNSVMPSISHRSPYWPLRTFHPVLHEMF